MKTTNKFLRTTAAWTLVLFLMTASVPAAAQSDTTRIEIGGMEFIITEKIKRMEKGISNLEKGKRTFEEQIQRAEQKIAEAEKEIARLQAVKDTASEEREDEIETDIFKIELELAENEKRIEAFEEGMEEIDEAMADLEEELEGIGDNFHEFKDFDFDDEKLEKAMKMKKFKGHWAGFEFGISNFMNADLSFPSTEERSFMELNPEKSFGFALNFMEFNLPLISQYFGMTTGMGVKWNHFNLAQNVDLYQDDNGVMQAVEIDPAEKEYKRNNLNMAYLTIPLIAEFQVPVGKEKLYLGGGATGSMRLWSKHKQKFFTDGVKYKDKVNDDFQLSPFRYGITLRAGYGPIGLFVNYELMPLFRDAKGPELYPVTVGLRILNF